MQILLLQTILGGIFMDENFYWDVFKNTGSIESYLTYKTVRASVDELKTQNSYFINGLYGA